MVTGAEAHGWLNDDNDWARRHIPRGRDDDVPDANGTKACLRPRGPVFIRNVDRTLYRGVGKLDPQRSGGAVAFARTGKEHAPVVRRAFVDGRRVVVRRALPAALPDRRLMSSAGQVANAVVHRLAEDVFDPIEAAPCRRAPRAASSSNVLVWQRRRELFEQLLLVLRQLLRRDDLDRDEQDRRGRDR